MKNVVVIGGGMKENIIASELGRHVNVMRFEKSVTNEALHLCDTIILPLPATDGEYITGTNIRFEDIFRCPGKTVVGGKIPKFFANFNNDFNIIDYAANDAFAIRNAVPTAEAAISLIIDNTPFTIQGSKCLVTGFGRVGKAIAKRLGYLGADVICCLRNLSQIAQAESEGFKVVRYDNYEKFRYDIIINTVPALIFDEQKLINISPELIIDLASLPGGCDFEAAKKLNIKAIHALSLPGKTAPLTAAKIITETIIDLLKPPCLK